jgi:hypothetical protein
LWLFIFGTWPHSPVACTASAAAGSVACAAGAGAGAAGWATTVFSSGAAGVSAVASSGVTPRSVLAVWCVVALGLVERCHRDVHRLALEQRRPFRDSVILDAIHEPGDQVSADLRMGQFPTSEADRHLDAVAVLEELDRAVDLRIEVADADLRREADLLEGDRALLALVLLLPLRQLVLVLPEVEEPDHRGLSHRSDLDEVVSPLLRHLEGSGRRHHA